MSLAFAGINLDNRSLPGVYIGIVIGRHAGFLTASSILARKYADDGPHLIYVPERAFDMEKFLSDIDSVYAKYHRCVVAVSEGIQDAEGRPILTMYTQSDERDAHGNIQLSGTGALGDILSESVKNKLKIKRVRSDTFGYLQRCFLGIVSESDAHEAREVGKQAVLYSVGESRSGSVAIRRTGDYAVKYFLTPLQTVAHETKSMPDEFIDFRNSTITDAFKSYAQPLIGTLPPFDRISAPLVKKILE